jgi:hypothetical protein
MIWAMLNHWSTFILLLAPNETVEKLFEKAQMREFFFHAFRVTF